MTREQRFIFLNLVHGPFWCQEGEELLEASGGLVILLHVGMQHDTSNTGHSRNTFPLAGMMMPIGFHIFWDGSTPKQIEGMSNVQGKCEEFQDVQSLDRKEHTKCLTWKAANFAALDCESLRDMGLV